MANEKSAITNYVHTSATRKVTTELDFFPTPARAVQALLEAEKSFGGFEGVIWEPRCGNGAISRELEAAGHEVVSSDIGNYGYGLPGIDFLADRSTIAQHVVTNPPYKLLQPFVEHALARVPGKVGMLARLAVLEGQRRKALHEKLSRVWVFRKRLQMLRNGTEAGNGGGSMIAFCWLVWDPQHRGPAQLGWV